MQLKPITVIAVLLLVVASLLVSGCTQTPTQSTSSPTPTKSPIVSVAQPTNRATTTIDAKQITTGNMTLIIDDRAGIVIDHMQVSATGVTVPQQIGINTPKPGYKFVGFNCTVKNIDAPRQATSSGYWHLRDTAGNVYDTSSATFSLPNLFKTVNTQPGDVINGVIVFEVPQNAQLKSLTYDYGS